MGLQQNRVHRREGRRDRFRRRADAKGARAVGEQAAAREEVDHQRLAGAQRAFRRTGGVRHTALPARRHDVAPRLLEAASGEDPGDFRLEARDAQALAFEPELPAPVGRGGETTRHGAQRFTGQIGDAADLRKLRRALLLAHAEQGLARRHEAPALRGEPRENFVGEPERQPARERDPPRGDAAAQQSLTQNIGVKGAGLRRVAGPARDVQVFRREQIETGGGRLVPFHRRQVAKARGLPRPDDHERLAELRGVDEEGALGIVTGGGEQHERLGFERSEELGEARFPPLPIGHPGVRAVRCVRRSGS